MTIEHPPLPYSHDALEPHISRRTLDFHHGKHHKTYVTKLNDAIADSDYSGMTLTEIIIESHRKSDSGVFNNAAQAWNHAFLWDSMSPDGGGDPEGTLKTAIMDAFGDVDTFRTRFKNAAIGQFGSGWAWLVHDGARLQILGTGNADTPLVHGMTPLLTLDVWEHAYYLDYQNDRARYVDVFLSDLINWDFAASGL